MNDKSKPIEIYIATIIHILDQNNDISNFLGKSNI